MSVELDMRHTDVESGRRSCGARFAILEDLLWRATERDTVRNMVTIMEKQMKKLQSKARSRVKWDGVGGCYSRTEKYPQVGNKIGDDVCHTRLLSIQRSRQAVDGRFTLPCCVKCMCSIGVAGKFVQHVMADVRTEAAHG